MSRRFVAAVALLSVSPSLLAQAGPGGFWGPPSNWPDPILPPPGGAYTARPGDFHSYGGGFFRLSDPIHDRFTGGMLPPMSGGTQVHSFGSSIRGMLSAGDMTAPVEVNGVPVTVRLTHLGEVEGSSVYETEMLQLDIAGGTLPPGAMIRESPTIASLGQTRITPGLARGDYIIESWFDVWTELSVDGGQTWIPSDAGVIMCLPAPGATATAMLGLLLVGRRRR